MTTQFFWRGSALSPEPAYELEEYQLKCPSCDNTMKRFQCGHCNKEWKVTPANKYTVVRADENASE
jgi:hypothetical protein